MMRGPSDITYRWNMADSYGSPHGESQTKKIQGAERWRQGEGEGEEEGMERKRKREGEGERKSNDYM